MTFDNIAQATRVRTANADDRCMVLSTLGAAFQNDPVASFIFPDASVRRIRLPRLFAIHYDLQGKMDARYVTAAGEAVALWRAPSHRSVSFREKVSLSVPWLAAVGSAFRRALAVSAASDANRPCEPHWYLDIIGCAPSMQGVGFGGVVMRAGLARADGDGLPSYVETANETNLGFYRAYGFVVTHRWRVPDGPTHWAMLRKPKLQPF